MTNQSSRDWRRRLETPIRCGRLVHLTESKGGFLPARIRGSYMAGEEIFDDFTDFVTARSPVFDMPWYNIIV